MTIQPATPEDIRNAMQHFDIDMRESADWQKWEEKNNHKFAFVDDERRYPMKEIISMATSTPNGAVTLTW